MEANDEQQPPVIRINSLDLTRCTEQCAILASFFIGRGETRARGRKEEQLKPTPTATKAPTVRRRAIECLMGYLCSSYSNGRLLHVYPCHDDVEKMWGRATAQIGQYANLPRADMDLDLVAAPLDGLRDLLAGRDGGSVSVIAGGTRGTFIPAEEMRQAHPGVLEYFVLTARHPLPVLRHPKMGGSGSLVEALGENDVIEQALKGDKPRNAAERIVGTLATDRPLSLREILRSHARLRTLQGSSVAAAMTVFHEGSGLDAYADIVNPTSAILIAAAALAKGGGLYAIPLVKDHQLASGTRVCDASFFVQNDSFFLNFTGITEGPVVRGVRFPEPGWATTETICLRPATGSSRRITQDHDLGRKRFRMLGASKRHSEKGFDESKYRALRYEGLLEMLE